MDGVIDVFVNKDIAFQVASAAKPDPEEISKLLAPEKVLVEKVTPSTEYLP